ncbi:acyl carrier protein [Candidatus Babeliales bacterium]|nr:acyl carrier protein [Candidatus Babeliales bacterium]
MEEILEKVIDIIVDKLGVEKTEVTEDSTFKDLGADSLDIVELIMSFEEAFNIEIDDEKAEIIETVRQAAKNIFELQ